MSEATTIHSASDGEDPTGGAARTPGPPRTPPFADDDARPVVLRRHPGDIVRIVFSAFLLFWTGWIARGRRLPRWEQDVFHLVNRLPSPAETPLVVLMQAGSLAAVPVVVVAALVYRKVRLARDLAVAGVAAWVLAHVLEEVVGRGHPSSIVQDVLLRGGGHTAGFGFPAVHVAVATSLAAAAGPYLSKWVGTSS